MQRHDLVGQFLQFRVVILHHSIHPLVHSSLAAPSFTVKPVMPAPIPRHRFSAIHPHYPHLGLRLVSAAPGIRLPVFPPGLSRVHNWLPTVGAIVNINTSSLYFQDHWVAAPRLSVDLGTRFEAVRTNATGDIVTVNTTTIVPRFGATFDVEGNGRTVVQASYGHYAGKYSEAQFAANTDVGNPSRITYGYTGPAGQGRDFAPGVNPANYTSVISASFPTANIFVADGLHSPTVREFTTSVGRELGTRGYARAT